MKFPDKTFVENIKKKFIFDLARSHDTFFVSSFARSGSTYLASLINCNKDHRVVFEPLNASNAYNSIQFDIPLYLDRNDPHDSLFHLFKEIDKGGRKNVWVDRENRVNIYHKKIIKGVRTNMLLGWLKQRFPTYTYVLLLRNPLMVINSWKRLKFERGETLRNMLLSNTTLSRNYLKPFIEELNKVQSDIELMIYVWCIYNYVPLREMASDELIVIRYEDLILNPSKQLSRINGNYTINYNTVLQNASSSSRRKMNYSKALEYSKRWKSIYSEETIIRTREILDKFGLTKYYDFAR